MGVRSYDVIKPQKLGGNRHLITLKRPSRQTNLQGQNCLKMQELGVGFGNQTGLDIPADDTIKIDDRPIGKIDSCENLLHSLITMTDLF